MKTELTHKNAVEFFAELFHGEHHIPAPGYEGAHGVREYGPGSWYVNFHGDLSTFDFDRLTALVFLAHDRCVRASVMSSGPRMVKIVIWNRDGRTGEMWSQHPTIETALERWRKCAQEKPLIHHL
jgi:hypothetical protein